jgi:hypothetical protein
VLSLIQQRPANRRSGRDFPVRDIRFLASDQLVFDLFALIVVVDFDGRAQADFVPGNIVHVRERQVSEPSAELAKSCLDELLALLGRVVLGVLAEITQGHGLLQFSWELVTELVLQSVDLFLELLLNMLCHTGKNYKPRLGSGLQASGTGLPESTSTRESRIVGQRRSWGGQLDCLLQAAQLQ